MTLPVRTFIEPARKQGSGGTTARVWSLHSFWLESVQVCQVCQVCQFCQVCQVCAGLCWSVPIPSPITAPSIRRALDDTLTRYLTWYPGPTPTPRLAWGDGRLSSSHGRENGKYSVINDAMEGRPETRDQRPEKFATAGKRRRGKEPM
jgi:hypothetical protein